MQHSSLRSDRFRLGGAPYTFLLAVPAENWVMLAMTSTGREVGAVESDVSVRVRKWPDGVGARGPSGEHAAASPPSQDHVQCRGLSSASTSCQGLTM